LISLLRFSGKDRTKMLLHEVNLRVTYMWNLKEVFPNA